MKSLSVAEFKAQFSSVLNDVKQGNEVQITYGRNKEPIAKIVPQPQIDYSIELGDLEKKGVTMKMHNFEMTEEEFLNS